MPRRVALAVPVQLDVETPCVRAAILAEIDRVSPYGTGEGPSPPARITPFADADDLFFLTERDAEGGFRFTFCAKKHRARTSLGERTPAMRTYCKGDRERVRRILMRDPAEIERLASLL